MSTYTNTWVGEDVWTKDKQPILFSASLTYARKKDSDSIKFLYENYNKEALDDEALLTLVMSRVPRIVKQITPTYTLDEMLGISDSDKSRATMAAEMFELLAAELDTCGIVLTDFGVNDVGVDDTFAAMLKEKASAQLAVELSAEKTRQLNEQIKQEEAQTKIDLEIAKRNNLVAEEEAKVYALSSEAYELERLKLLKDVIGSSSKVYFIPEGTDLSLYLMGESAEVDSKVIQSSTAD